MVAEIWWGVPKDLYGPLNSKKSLDRIGLNTCIRTFDPLSVDTSDLILTAKPFFGNHNLYSHIFLTKG